VLYMYKSSKRQFIHVFNATCHRKVVMSPCTRPRGLRDGEGSNHIRLARVTVAAIVHTVIFQVFRGFQVGLVNLL
jgi:hypothetical protein